jgi:uncharacterized protein YabE (DUF348 family)
VAALVTVVAAGVAWVATDHAVTLRVDGVTKVVHTHAGTVRGLLHNVGVKVGEHDVLSPSIDARIASGSEVVLDRARLITVTQDGRTRKVWVTSRSVDEALAHLGLDRRTVRLSASRRTRLPLSGLAFHVNTEKSVTLVADKERASVTTFAPTVAELLAERGLTLGERDVTEPAGDALLTDGATVTVRRVTVRTAVETITVPPPLSKRSDPSLMMDQKKVLSAGRSGRMQQSVEYLYADGVKIKRNVLTSTTLATPAPQVVVAGTRPYPADDTGLNWDGLARCESHNNPRAVSPNGTYHGLYQFNVQMWRRMGGLGLPSQATPREQTYRAIRLYKAAGRDQWPHCGKHL